MKTFQIFYFLCRELSQYIKICQQSPAKKSMPCLDAFILFNNHLIFGLHGTWTHLEQNAQAPLLFECNSSQYPRNPPQHGQKVVYHSEEIRDLKCLKIIGSKVHFIWEDATLSRRLAGVYRWYSQVVEKKNWLWFLLFILGKMKVHLLTKISSKCLYAIHEGKFQQDY